MQLVQSRKVSSTDVDQSPKPSNTIVQTQGSQDLKKKVTPYSDDDQDSGFGGNYTGSNDEGGLVFDWSCYSNYMDVTCDSFPYLVAGPSTSSAILRNPPPGMNISGSEVKLVSEDNLSSSGSKLSDNETHRPNDGGISSLESHLVSKPSDTRHCTGNMVPDSSDYRGKQPANKHYSKRNVKSPSSPSSTLLQLSLNEAASKKDETTAQAKKPDHSDGLHLRNNAHSVKDNTKSILQNTNSIQDNTSSVQDGTTSVQYGTTSVQGSVNLIKDNTNSVKDNTSIIQDNTNSIQDNTSSVKHNTSSFEDDTTSVEDNTTSVDDDTTSIQDSDNTNSIKDNTNFVQDNTNYFEGNTNSVLDEQHLASDAINKEIPLTTDQIDSKDSATLDEQHLGEDYASKEISSNVENYDDLGFGT